jgi:CHRD domain-containing protein
VPFDSSDSVLYRRITGIGFSDTQRMPLGGPFLNTHDENLIKAWIDMGAENDSGVLSPQFTRRALLNNIQVISLAPVLSAATGSATMVLDTTTSRLTGTVALSNMKNAVTAVHINEGDPGNNGDPVVSLVETPPGSGTWTVPDTAAALTAAQQERFKAAGLYISVDTSVNPGGEIRGQLLSYADNIQLIFNANCAGCHYPLGPAAFTGLDLSPNTSYTTLVNQPATQSTGARVIPFDADNSVLLQRITGVGFSSVVGSVMPPPSLVTPALSSHDQGLIKVWIIMGAMDNNGAVQAPQAPPSKQYTRNTFLNAIQVVSAVTSSATGTATVVLDTATKKLTGTVVISNMTNTVTAVHINDADADFNSTAPVMSLTETPPGSGTWTIPATAPALSDVQMNRFISAGFYISVDTSVNPGGEIRGQLQTYSGNVQPIFSGRCVKCHHPFGAAGYTGLILQPDVSYSNLVSQLATQTTGTRVVPFDAINSILFQRIMGTGPVITVSTLRMPQDGPPFLSTHESGIIKIWINMGALND